MQPLTERQKTLISNNVLAACKDITKLNKTGYNFLNLCSGFIAHYNLQGFISYYMDNDLQRDIEANAKANQWANFRIGETNAGYYHSKRDAYNMILGGLVARDALANQFNDPVQFLRDHFVVINVTNKA